MAKMGCRPGTTEFYVLECDACHQPMGWSSDDKHPMRGLTICPECWANPHTIPHYLS